MTRALPAHIGERSGLLQRLAARAPRRDHHGIAQLRQSEKVPAVQRNLHDLAVLDHVADFCGPALEERSAALDHDLFGKALHAERELQVETPADFERRLPGLWSKPWKRRPDLPQADSEGREEETPLGIRDTFDDGSGRGMSRGDNGSGKHAPGGILHDAGNFTGIGLSARGHARDEQRGQETTEPSEDPKP